jgi:hypothetical protein
MSFQEDIDVACCGPREFRGVIIYFLNIIHFAGILSILILTIIMSVTEDTINEMKLGLFITIGILLIIIVGTKFTLPELYTNWRIAFDNHRHIWIKLLMGFSLVAALIISIVFLAIHLFH